MRVLYIDHTSLVSGAQRALLDLLEGLPQTVQATLVCPPGPLADAAARLGVEVVPFAGTSGSLRLHPLHTPRALRDIARSARVVVRAARLCDADVIHANSLRAGLIAGCAKPFVGRPVVVHIHDALPGSRSAGAVRRALLAAGDAFITISDYTTRNLAAREQDGPVHMLHNPLDAGRFDPARLTRMQAREQLSRPGDEPLIGLVAQITPWKGQELAIRALARIAGEHPRARLLIVGEAKFVDRATRYDNPAYLRDLHALAAELGVADRVEFLGEREDVVTIVRALDVALAPSWEEPFGRSVIEAMALGTPVIATDVGGPGEYIEDGVDGILLPPRDPEPWAAALLRLLGAPGEREEIGRRGSEKARRLFDRDHYVERVLGVYDEAVAPAPTRRLKVLLVDHQSLVGGGQRSFLELTRVLALDHDLTFACPEGPLAAAVRALGVTVRTIPESQLAYRADLRRTPIELSRAAQARRAIRALCVELEPDVVHANTLRAGLLASRRRGSPPVVIHCRDLFPAGPVAAAVRRMVRRRSAAIVAVSEAVAVRLAGPGWADHDVFVVDNPVDPSAFDPGRYRPSEVRAAMGLQGGPVVGVLAQITPWKGQTHAVRVLERLRRTHPGAELVLAGEAKFVSAATTYDNRAYEREIAALVGALGLGDVVHLIGEQPDPQRIIAALDVLLVPSTAEPFGRTVAEALAMRVPVVATCEGGPAEVIRPGVDGVVLAPRDVAAWAEAAGSWAGRRLGEDSRNYAIERFHPDRHAARVLEIYARVLRATARGGRGRRGSSAASA